MRGNTDGNCRVLVTGVTGFIGSRVAGHLQHSFPVAGTGRGGVSPLPLPYWGGLLEGEGFVAFLRSFRPDAVVHAAGPSSVGASLRDPAADFRAGPELVMQLYDSADKAGIKPFLLHISSAAVYGDPLSLPVAEDAPARPLSPYGWHKRMAELVGREYARNGGIPGMALRVFSCYGAGQRKLLLWDAARKLMSGEAVFSGTGKETRDYIHVRDLARLVELLVREAPREGFACLNAGSGRAVTVEDMIRGLGRALGLGEVRPLFDGRTRQGDPPRWRADTRALSSLGFAPEVGLDEGVRDYAEWFLSLDEEERKP